MRQEPPRRSIGHVPGAPRAPTSGRAWGRPTGQRTVTPRIDCGMCRPYQSSRHDRRECARRGRADVDGRVSPRAPRCRCRTPPYCIGLPRDHERLREIAWWQEVLARVADDMDGSAQREHDHEGSAGSRAGPNGFASCLAAGAAGLVGDDEHGGRRRGCLTEHPKTVESTARRHAVIGEVHRSLLVQRLQDVAFAMSEAMSGVSDAPGEIRAAAPASAAIDPEQVSSYRGALKLQRA